MPTTCQSGCKELICCPEDDLSYVIGCTALDITDTRISLPDATVGSDYSEGVAQTGSSPKHYSISSGSLPAGLSILESDGTIYGNPDTGTEGDYEFTISGYNDCGTTSKSFFLTVGPAPTPENYVWGDPWIWTVPEIAGATYYIATGLPAGVSATGFFNNEYASSGVTAGATLGTTPLSVQGYLEDLVTPIGDPVVYPDLTTSYRVYWGECDTLPTEFTRSDILALKNGTEDGPRTILLQENLRDKQFSFPATSSAKYRVIVVPELLFVQEILTSSSGDRSNVLRYSDNTYPTFIPGPTAINPAWETLYYNLVYMDQSDSLVLSYVIVMDATSSAFNIFCRALVNSRQSSAITHPANSPPLNETRIGAGIHTSPWVDTTAISQLNPSEGELLEVTAGSQIRWAGGYSWSNLQAFPNTYDGTITNTVTYDIDGIGVYATYSVSWAQLGISLTAVVPGPLIPIVGTYSNVDMPLHIRQDPSDGSTVTTDFTSQKSLFVGTGTVNWTVTCAEQIDLLVGAVNKHGTADVFESISSSVSFATRYIDYVWYAH